MGLRINNNVAAFNAFRNLSKTDESMGKSLEKLSSGFRINRAADDASGLVISEKLRAQVGGLKTATKNAQDGVSVVQTAEGALTEVHSILQRMRDLAQTAANSGSQDSDSKQAAQDEIVELRTEIDRIANTTKFGDQVLLDGGLASSGLTFRVGSGTSTNDDVTVTIDDMNTAALGTGTMISAIDVTSDADAAVDSIDEAISQVSDSRAGLGAAQNRFEHAIANLGVSAENLGSAESRIRDADMASESVAFTRNQVLMQAGVAALAQANAVPQNVLRLLG